MHRVLSRLRTMSMHMHVYVVEMSGHFERVDNLLHWVSLIMKMLQHIF